MIVCLLSAIMKNKTLNYKKQKKNRKLGVRQWGKKGYVFFLFSECKLMVSTVVSHSLSHLTGLIPVWSLKTPPKSFSSFQWPRLHSSFGHRLPLNNGFVSGGKRDQIMIFLPRAGHAEELHVWDICGEQIKFSGSWQTERGVVDIARYRHKCTGLFFFFFVA